MSRVQENMKPKILIKESARMIGKKTSICLLALTLGGCASYQKDHFTVGSVPEDYRTKHPIVVSQSEVYEDLIVTPHMKGMSFRHQNVVTAFLSRFRRSGAKEIRVVLPAGSHNEAAARRVGKDIIAHMKDERIPASQIKVVRYHASNHGEAATLRVSFDAVSAELTSECGQWNEDLVETSQNKNYGNFGCATQNNLAKMIANPEDLISPRGESEIDAERRDNVINDWRENGTPSLPSLL
ncbi:MAG: CpaD family pilus assembly lipoprotein [Pseudomonadota bacterium]